jgi:TrpR family transcriptional regulator, trp operon repressor
MIRDDALVAANIAEMAQALATAEPELIEKFIYSLLTPSEADEIAKRWALVKEIARGTPQREIAKTLGLSLCKITRGSRELKKEGSPFRKMLELAGTVTVERGGSHRGRRFREAAKLRNLGVMKPAPVAERQASAS